MAARGTLAHSCLASQSCDPSCYPSHGHGDSPSESGARSARAGPARAVRAARCPGRRTRIECRVGTATPSRERPDERAGLGLPCRHRPGSMARWPRHLPRGGPRPASQQSEDCPTGAAPSGCISALHRCARAQEIGPSRSRPRLRSARRRRGGLCTARSGGSRRWDDRGGERRGCDGSGRDGTERAPVGDWSVGRAEPAHSSEVCARRPGVVAACCGLICATGGHRVLLRDLREYYCRKLCEIGPII